MTTGNRGPHRTTGPAEALCWQAPHNTAPIQAARISAPTASSQTSTLQSARTATRNARTLDGSGRGVSCRGIRGQGRILYSVFKGKEPDSYKSIKLLMGQRISP